MCKRCDLIDEIQKLHDEIGIRTTQFQLELQLGNEKDAARCEETIMGNQALILKKLREVADFIQGKEEQKAN